MIHTLLTMTSEWTLLNQIINYANENEIEIKRDIGKLEGEWYIHNVCYNLGIERGSTKDADLDFVQDARWYVNFATDVASLLYSSHKYFDSYQTSYKVSETGEAAQTNEL